LHPSAPRVALFQQDELVLDMQFRLSFDNEANGLVLESLQQRVSRILDQIAFDAVIENFSQIRRNQSRLAGLISAGAAKHQLAGRY
jgi:hypothetical protein